MQQNKIRSLKCLAETKYLSLYDAAYENKAGHTKNWIIASRKDHETLKKQYFEEQEDAVDAVVVAALHEPTESLVLIRQFRIPINDYVYELPAGLIDKGEDIKEAVRRELKEETGLMLKAVNEKLGSTKTYLSAGMTEESAALIFCTCEGSLSDEFLEEDEMIEAFLVSQQEAERLLGTNSRIDVKALMALQGFAKLGVALFE